MERAVVSKITCVVDSSISHLVHRSLEDLRMPDVFTQAGKQLSLRDGYRFLTFGERTSLSESRAEIVRFFVPPRFEDGVANRVAEAADLRLPGRGCLYAETVELSGESRPEFDETRLEAIAGPSAFRSEPYVVVCCIVRRGMGESMARTALDMGLCVPVVSFGEGMGLRDKLGLLRITVPVDKEIIYFLVPERDADLLSSLVVHKARLDRPGQGFLYRYRVRASAVNVSVRTSAKRHAASFDQVIAALDDLRGSTEWRRSHSRERAGEGMRESGGLRDSRCVSLYCDAGKAGEFVRAAMEAGAGGATLVDMAWRGEGDRRRQRTVSHARESCDLVVPESVVDGVLRAVADVGFLGANGMAEISSVQFAVTYRD